MLKTTEKALIFALLFIFLPNTAFSDDLIQLPPPPTSDLAMEMLKIVLGYSAQVIFGIDVPSEKDSVIGAISEVLNLGIMGLAIYLVGYSTVIHSIMLNTEGRAFKTAAMSAWIPLRIVWGMGLMFPWASGYSGIQLLTMYAAGTGVGLGNAGTKAALEFAAHKPLYPQLVPMAHRSAAEDTLTLLTCITAINIHDNAENVGRVWTRGDDVEVNWSLNPIKTTLSALHYLSESADQNHEFEVSVKSIPKYTKSLVNNPLQTLFPTVNSAFSNKKIYDSDPDQLCGEISLTYQVPTMKGYELDDVAAKRSEMIGKIFDAYATLVNELEPLAKAIAVKPELANRVGATYIPPNPDSFYNAYNKYGIAIETARTEYLKYAVDQYTAGNTDKDWMNDVYEMGFATLGFYYNTLHDSDDQIKEELEFDMSSSVNDAIMTFNSNHKVPSTDVGILAGAMSRLNDYKKTMTVGFNGQPMTTDFLKVVDARSEADVADWGWMASLVNTADEVAGDSIDSAGEWIVTNTAKVGIEGILFHDGEGSTKSPLTGLRDFGHAIIGYTQAILAAYGIWELGKWIMGFVAKKAGPIAAAADVAGVFDDDGDIEEKLDKINHNIENQSLKSFTLTLLIMLLGFGAFCAFYLPLLPFIIYTTAIVGWLTMVVEAVIASPIIALGHVIPDQSEGLTAMSKPGYLILLSLVLRPILMVIGFFSGMLIIDAFGMFLLQGYKVAILSAAGDHVVGLLTGIISTMIFIGLAINLITKSIGLTTELPDKVMRVVGQGAESFGDQHINQQTGGFVTGAIQKVQHQSFGAVGGKKRPAAPGMKF